MGAWVPLPTQRRARPHPAPIPDLQALKLQRLERCGWCGSPGGQPARVVITTTPHTHLAEHAHQKPPCPHHVDTLGSAPLPRARACDAPCVSLTAGGDAAGPMPCAPAITIASSRAARMVEIVAARGAVDPTPFKTHSPPSGR